jgi:4-hydroxymandelate oxidase
MHTDRDRRLRRQLLRWALQSPLLAAIPEVGSAEPGALDLISDPSQALNVMDFEAVARARLPPAHFAYLATGTDDEATLRANRAGFGRYGIRARRLVDVHAVDASVELLGERYPSPIAICPTSSDHAFHPEGMSAVAGAAAKAGSLMMLSTLSSTPIEQANERLGRPVWFQLYPTNDWQVTRGLIRRARSAGCTVLVLTVDLQAGSNRETEARGRRVDTRDCSACHTEGFSPRGRASSKPMFQGLDLSRVTDFMPLEATWDFVDRVRDESGMKLLIKGIVTAEDAELAVARRADGIIVSNHGGRAEDSNRPTIECLPEVVAAVRGRVPVLVDSGFRRGTDVFKALAMGADAVGVGRPYLWGLAAYGQPGVEAVLEILRRELELVMRQAGTINRSKISLDSIAT